ncbi:hypothetical protein WJX82_003553 [Trebouxia sp. C0006]
MDFVGMHMPTVTAPTQIIYTGPSSSSSSLACKPFSQRSGISRMPAAATSKRKSSNGQSNRSTRQNSQQPRHQASGIPRPSPAKSTPPTNKAFTPPMTVQVEAQLANLEQAANPWWSTFCGISNGVWLGQTAAFAPSTGAAEALALGQDGKPVMDMHTQVTEERVCEGLLDFVTRRVARAEDEAELASVGQQLGGSGNDWDEEVLNAEEEGLVFFDGGSYSRGPLSLTNPATGGASADPHQGQHAPAGSESKPVSALDEAEGQGEDHPGKTAAEEDEEDDEGIEAQPDEGGSREAGEEVVTLEQCLAWGGEQRQRCRLTMSVSGGGETGEELDISLLRITLYHEYWQGLLHELDLETLPAPPSSSAASQGGQHQESALNTNRVEQASNSERLPSLTAANEADAKAQGRSRARLSKGSCMSAKKLSGSWKAFDLTAVPIDETDPSTGITKKAMVYFSQETKQLWSANGPKQQQDAGAEAIDGGALWLPGNVVLELQMLPMVSRGAVADEVEGMSTSDTGRGLLISFSWLVRPGMMISMQREYDACGDLMEEFRILHQLQKSIAVVAYDSLDSSRRIPKVLFQNADCCKRFGPPRSQVGYLIAIGTLTEEAQFSRQQWLLKASQAQSTFQSHMDAHALFRPLFSGINKDMPSCLIGTDSKVIQVQLGQHQIVSAVLHVMEMDSTSEDLRARAMNERNPVHSMLFCQQGELLTANAAARQGVFLPSSNIMFRDLFSAEFYAEGSEEADTHFKAAMKAVFEEQVDCYRHKQCHKSKKSGKLKWAMMEMWPMTDPVDNSPAVLVKRYNITDTMQSEHEANVRQSSLQRQNEELEQASLAIQEEKERLEKEAQSLAQQLQAVLNDKFVPQRDFDADTPIDKTLKMMQTIIGGGVPTVQDALDLRFILSKSDTDLRQPVGLKQQLMADNRLDSVVGMSMLQLLQGDVVNSDAAVKRVAQRHAGPTAPWTLNADIQEDDEPEDSESRMDELSDGQQEFVPYCVMPYVERLLQAAEKNWQFDIFGLAEATPGNTLSLLAFHLFKQAGHVKKFSLDEGKLCRYLHKIEQGYDAGNPYHNSLHVASVLQMTHMLLCHGGLLKSNAFAGSLHLASYWSAVVHDFEHGGLNNDFLIKTAHPIALIYNDQSPLENHHLAAAFGIWIDPQCQYMTKQASPELVRMGRNCAINQVLGTDMKKHFDIVSRFQAVFKKPPSSNASSHGSTTPTGHSQDWTSIKPEDQTLIHQMVLKCADVGHLAADPKTHKRWAYQLEEEFFRQGDKEKELGLPVSPLMDRQQTGGMTRSQLGFFGIVGIPLFRAITELFKDAQPMMDGVLANYRMWEAAAAASTPP